MAEGPEPSFGWLVLVRAWFGAWAFFDSWQRDLAVFVVSFTVGETAYYRQHGLPATWRDGVDNLIHLAAPVVIIWLLLFVWHLWLAPSALAYEAARRASTVGPGLNQPQPSVPTVNWAVWKQRSSYDLRELAAILAKEDPNLKASSNAAAYLDLIKDDAMTGKLTVSRDQRAENYYKPDLWPSYFKVPKAGAMKWAGDKGFDLSHIV